MYKIIGGDQKEYGPSTAEEIRQWVAEGRADARTLVKAEGQSDWKPLASFPEFAGLTFPKPAPPVAAPPHIVQPFGEAFPAAEQPLPIGVCLKSGWQLLMKNFGLLFFATVAVCGVRILLSAVEVVNVFALLFKGVFYGGLYLVFLKCLRNQPTRLTEAFSGFGENFVQLLLVGVVRLILTFIGFLFCVIPGIVLLVAWIFAVPLVADKRLVFWDAMELSRRVAMRHWIQLAVLLVICFLPVIVFSIYTDVVSMNYISAAMHDGRLNTSLWVQNFPEFMSQMEKVSQAFAQKYGYLGLIQLAILLLVQPFAKAVLMCAYEILFNPRPTPPA